MEPPSLSKLTPMVFNTGISSLWLGGLHINHFYATKYIHIMISFKDIFKNLRLYNLDFIVAILCLYSQLPSFKGTLTLNILYLFIFEL